MSKQWMIYGATGYTGKLMVEEALAQGLKPVLAGRNADKLKAIAEPHGLQWRAFSLDDNAQVAKQLHDQTLVLHCAGPFSHTAKPMLEACLASQTHYLDITGEIAVFELAHGMNARAKSVGILVCPGVGFDVVPTDCVAATLKQALPDAHELSLGFDSRSGLSPGTAKSSVEGLKSGGKVRRNGAIETVPFAYQTRRIDFGDGEKLALTIPWGDVSTAFYTTGIPNIETFIPGSPKLVKRMKMMNYVRPLLGLGPVQSFMKRQIDNKVRGPNQAKRAQLKTYVWGEARNQAGKSVSARLVTANGYDVTVYAAVAIVEHLLDHEVMAGATTPAQLMGSDFATKLPGSSDIEVRQG